ncbi:hypothetical protein [Wolbachia endosymbiont of Rhagoletis cerasi]|nr:hypothetical protein [Wolbachia endosymbiont of Rhagoletis cerasi]
MSSQCPDTGMTPFWMETSVRTLVSIQKGVIPVWNPDWTLNW